MRHFGAFLWAMISCSVLAADFPDAKDLVLSISSFPVSRLIGFKTNVVSVLDSEMIGLSLAREFKIRYEWMNVQKRTGVEDGCVHWGIDLCPCACDQLKSCKTRTMYPKITIRAMTHEIIKDEGFLVCVDMTDGKYASIDWGNTCSNHVSYCCVETNEVTIGHFFENDLQRVVESRGTCWGRLMRPVGPLNYFRARVHPSSQLLCVPASYYVDSEKKWAHDQELLKDVDLLYHVLSQSAHSTVDMTILYDNQDFNISLLVKPGSGKITKEEGRPPMGVL